MLFRELAAMLTAAGEPTSSQWMRMTTVTALEPSWVPMDWIADLMQRYGLTSPL